jgi:hypothetical protein
VSSSKSFAPESPFLQGQSILAAPETEAEVDLRRIESPFLFAELGFVNDASEEPRYEREADFEQDTPDPDPPGLRVFRSKTTGSDVAVLATQAAQSAKQVEMLVYLHGLDSCDPPSKRRPKTFITQAPFRLGRIVEASARPIVLVVPWLEWRPGTSHALGQPKVLNALIAEVIATATGMGAVTRLILAGHSRAYDVLNPLAGAHGDSAMTTGALADLTHVWAIDTTYSAPVADWEAWLRSRTDLNISVIYRDGEPCQEGKPKRATTGVYGAKFRALQKRTALAFNERFSVIAVPTNVVGHCQMPGEYLPTLLRSLGSPVSAKSKISPQHERLDGEDEERYDEPEESFGPDDDEVEEEDAPEYKETDEDEVDEMDQEDVEEEIGTLDSSGLTPAERKAVEITSTFETGRRGGFPGLSGVQLRHVRTLLDRARSYCEELGLKSEMSFTFLFDAVSSHGKSWLMKKWDGVEKRRVLLSPRLATLDATHGKGNVPEPEVLLAIADVLGETSAKRSRQKVRIRKQWFVTGNHPRAAELKGLTPRADVSYLAAASSPAATTSAPAAPAHRPQATVTTKLAAQAIAQLERAAEPIRTAITRTLALDVNRRHTPESWFEGMVPATFLGLQIQGSGGVDGVHRDLRDVLQRAERTLLGQFAGRTAEEVGREMNVRRIGGFRSPAEATGGTQPSMHCFGLAIDINHPTNPFIGNDKGRDDTYKENRSPKIIQRAMVLLYRDRKFDIETAVDEDVEKAWNFHHRASEALAAYLRLADEVHGDRVRRLVEEAQAAGDGRTLEEWKKWIAVDRQVLAMKKWDFVAHPNPQERGYMDLPRELVVALVGAGLKWGGQYSVEKDMMHFDLRTSDIRKRVDIVRPRRA